MEQTIWVDPKNMYTLSVSKHFGIKVVLGCGWEQLLQAHRDLGQILSEAEIREAVRQHADFYTNQKYEKDIEPLLNTENFLFVLADQDVEWSFNVFPAGQQQEAYEAFLKEQKCGFVEM